MPTLTTNYGLQKPLVNSATDQDLWGGQLNNDLDGIDSLMSVAINWVPASETANFSVTAPTSGSTTVGDDKKLFLCDATGGAITASLPAAATCSGMTIAVKKTDASANPVTIQGNGAETIDGSNTYPISTQYAWVLLACNGTAWEIISATGWVNGTALANGTTATTQSAGDNTTKVATDAFVQAAARFGAWDATKTTGTSYLAATDGLVLVTAAWSGTSIGVQLKTDASNPPTTIRQTIFTNQNSFDMDQCAFMPVRKGDYWSVIKSTGNPTVTIFWLPIGN